MSKETRPKVPRVSKAELLRAFEAMCRKIGVESAGFDPKAITAPIDGSKHDGVTRWAISYNKRFGYMIVSGAYGCGCPLSRFNGYVKNRWDLLMLIEAVTHAPHY
jgi:hypothetical protein